MVDSLIGVGLHVAPRGVGSEVDGTGLGPGLKPDGLSGRVGDAVAPGTGASALGLGVGLPRGSAALGVAVGTLVPSVGPKACTKQLGLIEAPIASQTGAYDRVRVVPVPGSALGQS